MVVVTALAWEKSQQVNGLVLVILHLNLKIAADIAIGGPVDSYGLFRNERLTIDLSL